MKKILIAFGLLFGSASAFAALPMLTYQTAISSITTTIVSVSSSPVAGATQVDNPQLVGRVAIEIQNIDSSANLWCVPSSSASLTTNTAIGRKIAAGNSWIVSISSLLGPTNPISAGTTTGTLATFWCISDSTNATSKAAVTQLY